MGKEEKREEAGKVGDDSFNYNILNKMIKNTNIAVNTPIATHCLRSKTNGK